MKPIKLLALLLLLSIPRTVSAVDYFTLMDGDWFTNNLWGRNSAINPCGCNPDADGVCDIIIPPNTVIYIRHVITSTCNISIGSNATIVVQNGGSLTLSGNAGVTGTGDFVVDAGGTVNVGGNFSLTGNGDVDINGTLNVNGNISFGGNASLCGSGSVNVGGTVTGGAPCVSITLPVTLYYFTAFSQGKLVRTEWVTLSEQNNMYFTIERSDDGINYSAIGQVNGSMNSNFAIQYFFNDESPLNGVSYYRLRQTDVNNVQKVYDPVVVIRDEVYVTPNLIALEDEINIYLNGFDKELVTIEIVDASGKRVHSSMYKMNSDNEKVVVPRIQNLAKGMYFVYVHSAERRNSLKLMVQ